MLGLTSWWQTRQANAQVSNLTAQISVTESRIRSVERTLTFDDARRKGLGLPPATSAERAHTKLRLADLRAQSLRLSQLRSGTENVVDALRLKPTLDDTARVLGYAPDATSTVHGLQTAITSAAATRNDLTVRVDAALVGARTQDEKEVYDTEQRLEEQTTLADLREAMLAGDGACRVESRLATPPARPSRSAAPPRRPT